MHINNLRTLLAWGSQELAAAGIATPAADTAIIASHVLDVSRGELDAMAILGREIESSDGDAIRRCVARRAQREPLQHILGVAYFYGLELSVGRGVFVPRPETESLVDRVAAALPDRAHVADLGTGSGAIALALATVRPDVTVVAVERDEAALPWTRQNIAKSGLAQVSLLEGSYFDVHQVWEHLGVLDAVISNPPYIPSDQIPDAPEVRDYDPGAALYSGADGLDDIRRIIALASHYLRPGGSLWFEHFSTQGDAIRTLLTAADFANTSTFPDLSGRDRFTSGVLQQAFDTENERKGPCQPSY